MPLPPSASGSTTVLDHCDGVGDSKNLAIGLDVSSSDSRNNRRPIPHIYDIMSVTVELEDTVPIEKVIQTATTYLNQAMSLKNFGKPEIALKDYMRATIILNETIKRNKGWIMLQIDNKPQLERYQMLLSKAKAARPDFQKIMDDIVADNSRSGAQPLSRRAEQNGSASSTGSANMRSTNPGAVSTAANGDHVASGEALQPERISQPPPEPVNRARPVVHPKPQALHGNAIKPGAGSAAASSKSAQDLAQRFANLRASTVNALQDPRIRTQPIIPPVPAARKSSKQTRIDTSVDTIASLPKMPEAIYSPARGTVSSEAAQLPSSTPRGIFSRTNSTASFVGVSRTTTSPPPEDYFRPAQSFGSSGSLPACRKPSLPDTDTVKVEDLVRYMRAGSKEISILLIDVRPREDFQNGHIMSQATICIEPDILLRPDLSAAEIADAMVLGAPQEEELFRSRHTFDLVVIYDEASRELPHAPSTCEEMAILSLFNALSLFDFESGSGPKVQPKLLQGGIDGWTQVMGNSLQTSIPTTSPLSRATGRATSGSFYVRQSIYEARPIQNADEARQWREQMEDRAAFAPVRSTEDFLRRYPAVGDIRQSMTAPVAAIPSPPTRPAPALPRPSHSGLAESDAIVLANAAGPVGSSGGWQRRPGLNNPHNWCYANSTLQALFNTRGFSDELSSGTWQNVYKVPKKAHELIQNPQLMARCLQSLFYVLNDGKASSVDTSVLMNYVRFLSHRRDQHRDPNSLLGGTRQQDASEFFDFITRNLDDETNIHRNVNTTLTAQFEDPTDLNDSSRLGPTLSLARNFWANYSKTSSSLLDKYFRSVEVEISECKACHHQRKTFVPYATYLIDITDSASTTGPVKLADLLAAYFNVRDQPDARCERCGAKGRLVDRKIARLPDRLVIVFPRFLGGATVNDTRKDLRLVQFPFYNMNLGTHFVQGESFPQDDDHFNPSREFGLYNLYAVVTHRGNAISNGHYVAYVKNHRGKPDDWLYITDSMVQDFPDVRNPGSQRRIYGNYNDSETAYMLFYEREKRSL